MKRSSRWIIGAALLRAACTAPAGTVPDFHAMPMEDLVRHVQRDGTTEVKRENKRRAREELQAHQGAALDYLMSQMHVENMWISILADEIMRSLDAAEAAPILLRYVASEHVQTRKTAIYLLGLKATPEYADRIMPLLADDAVAGAAVRTLGKWRIQAATPCLVTHLRHAKERRRILAANALHDIGDPRTAPDLIAALDDPYVTVRKAAARALAAMGRAAEKEVLAALAGMGGPARRELVGVLGQIRTRRALRTLRRLRRDADPWIRDDAARALAAISARGAEG